MTVMVTVAVQPLKMNAAIVAVTTHPVLIVLARQMVMLQMKVVVAAKLVHLAVIMPVVQHLQMMNAAYAVVIILLVQMHVVCQMVIPLQIVQANVLLATKAGLVMVTVMEQIWPGV